MNPLVSVVIATRNRPAMLREAISSVLGQDLDADLEVVVVADQSEPDHTLASTRNRRRVRVVRNERRPGLAGARNCGIEASTSEYVAFCDDDDYWTPTKLRRQLELMASEPAAGLSSTGIRVEYDGASFPRVLETGRVTFEELLRNRHTELHPSTFLLRRSVLEASIGLVDEDVPGGFGEDYEFLLRAARAHPVLNVAEPLTVVRWGGQSFFFRRWQTMEAGLSWLLERYPEFESSPRGSARMHGQIAFAHAAMGHRRAALHSIGQTLRRRPVEPRAYLAAAVATQALSADRVMDVLHRRGRGI